MAKGLDCHSHFRGNDKMLTWGIAETAGMASQARALALALGCTPEMKTLPVKAPWGWLPNLIYATSLGGLIFKHFVARDVHPPYPELVISCGRRASMAALGLKQIIGNGNTKFIHIHDPCVPLKCFDLVVTVDHDKLSGPNVIKTRFALHAVTPAALAQAREHFAPRFADYPKPLIAVLLGGTTHHYNFTPEAMAQVIAALQRLPGSLLITPSRRTGEENIAMLKAAFAGNPRVYIYDGGENPYLGLLALADYLIVTSDSVNMMSEAAATGKPLYILPLPGHRNTKQARFAANLIREGIARPLGEKLEKWDYKIENEMEWLAQEVRQRLMCHPALVAGSPSH